MTSDIAMRLVPQSVPSSAPKAGEPSATNTAKATAPRYQVVQSNAQTGNAQNGMSPPDAVEKEVSGEELEEAVEHLNDLVQAIRRELSFSLDDSTNRTVITVRDSLTDEVVRQIPPEEILSLIEHLQKFEGGLFKGEA